VSHDASNWGSGFLPSQYQGVPFRSGKDPVLYISNPSGVDMQDRRSMLDVIGRLSETQHESSDDPEIPAKVSQYEMAYRMMTSVPEVADISDEPDNILDLYGPDVRRPGTFARNCLLAGAWLNGTCGLSPCFTSVGTTIPTSRRCIRRIAGR
jgi:hypothetical protein